MQIETKYIRAVSRAMAKKDIRYYLNGMKIESTAESVVLIAIDGHRMHVCRFPNSSGEIFDAIIPADLVSNALKMVGRKVDFVEFFIRENRASFAICGDIVSAMCVDGLFPDWRRVIPALNANTMENPTYRPEYVQAANDAIIDITGSKNTIYPLLSFDSGVGAMRKDNFLAIIMPVRFDADNFSGESMAWFKGE